MITTRRRVAAAGLYGLGGCTIPPMLPTYQLPSQSAPTPLRAGLILRVLLFALYGSLVLLAARVACSAWVDRDQAGASSSSAVSAAESTRCSSLFQIRSGENPRSGAV